MTDLTRNLWGAADAYERYMGRWSRKLAPEFLNWLKPAKNLDWVDLGCGTGELTRQIADRFEPRRLAGVDKAQLFVEQAKILIPSADIRAGDAADTGFDNSSFDVAVSGLVLNFLPDKKKALEEMVRLLRPGGLAALYVWDYAGHMQIMRYFFDAARELDPESVAYDDGVNAPICRPGPLEQAFREAGLLNVESVAIDIATPFSDFDDYWTPFLGGTGSAPKYCMSLDDIRRQRLRENIRQRLPTGPDGEILLAARAWGVKGIANS